MTSIYKDNDPHSLELVEDLGQDNSQEELDFSYLFLYNPSDDFRVIEGKSIFLKCRQRQSINNVCLNRSLQQLDVYSG